MNRLTGSVLGRQSYALLEAPRPVRDNSRRRFDYHRFTLSLQIRAIAYVATTGALLLSPAQQPPSVEPLIVSKVVAHDDQPAHQYRALRRLEAQSDSLGNSAWIEAWTEVDPVGGFRF